MTKYAVDFSGWVYVDAEDGDIAFADVYYHLAQLLDNFEIVNVEEVTDD